MYIKSQVLEGIEIVSPIGRIDLSTFSTLRRYFEKRYEGRGAKVILDLSQVDFISTGAIGGIIAIKQRLEEGKNAREKGQLVLSNLEAVIVSNALSSDEFAKHLTTFPTQADAVASLKSKK